MRPIQRSVAESATIGMPPATPRPPMLATPVDPFPGSGLTRREREVLMTLATGASNREIGEALYLSEKTVKQHVSNAMRKLGARNRTQLALMFLAASHDPSAARVDPTE